MSESAEQPERTLPEIQARLRDVAAMLRQSTAIDRAAKRDLAELVEELNRTLDTTALPTPELTQLAESTAHLAESLHRQQTQHLPARARERLEQALSDAEAHAPLAVGLARRLVETLANLGV